MEQKNQGGKMRIEDMICKCGGEVQFTDDNGIECIECGEPLKITRAEAEAETLGEFRQ